MTTTLDRYIVSVLPQYSGNGRPCIMVGVDTWSDWPTHYHTGEIGYQSPRRIPAYVKGWVRRAYALGSYV